MKHLTIDETAALNEHAAWRGFVETRGLHEGDKIHLTGGQYGGPNRLYRVESKCSDNDFYYKLYGVPDFHHLDDCTLLATESDLWDFVAGHLRWNLKFERVGFGWKFASFELSPEQSNMYYDTRRAALYACTLAVLEGMEAADGTPA